jgi:ADP-heptose:LPS heptosyltransferase
MDRASLSWTIPAVLNTLKTELKKSARDLGDFLFHNAVWFARHVGILPMPKPGDSILVINLTSHFGDGILLLPMLEAIHNAHPGTPIDIACSKGVDSLFEAVPYLRHIYAAPLSSVPPFTFRLIAERRFAILRWYLMALRNVHPEVCLMPRWGDDLFASFFLAYLIDAPQRIAYASTVNKDQPMASRRDRLLTRAIEGGSGLHEPLRFLRVAQQGGLIPANHTFRTDVVSPTLQQVTASVDWPALRDRLALPQDKPLAILAPGASSPNKTWPAERWVEAAHQILDSGFNVVLLSGNADRTYAEGIATTLQDSRIYLVAGATTLPESIALLSHSACFLGNDSGPGHAAGALGIPSVILFVSSKDVSTDNSFSSVRIRPMGPYVQPLHPTLLPPCKDVCLKPTHCIATISSDDAVAALLSLYRQKLKDSHALTNDANR